MPPCGIATRSCQPLDRDYSIPLDLFLKWSSHLFVWTIATFTLFSNGHHSTFCLRSEYTIPRRKRLKSFQHQKNASPQRIGSDYYVPRPQSVSCALCSTRSLATTKQYPFLLFSTNNLTTIQTFRVAITRKGSMTTIEAARGSKAKSKGPVSRL